MSARAPSRTTGTAARRRAADPGWHVHGPARRPRQRPNVHRAVDPPDHAGPARALLGHPGPGRAARPFGDVHGRPHLPERRPQVRLGHRTETSTGRRLDVTVARLSGTKVGPVVRTIGGSGTRAGCAGTGGTMPAGRSRRCLPPDDRGRDPAGNRAGRGGAIGVDDTRPTLSLNLAPLRIAPDGDGVAGPPGPAGRAADRERHPVDPPRHNDGPDLGIRLDPRADGHLGRPRPSAPPGHRGDVHDAARRPRRPATWPSSPARSSSTGRSGRCLGPTTFDPQDGDRLRPPRS